MMGMLCRRARYSGASAGKKALGLPVLRPRLGCCLNRGPGRFFVFGIENTQCSDSSFQDGRFLFRGRRERAAAPGKPVSPGLAAGEDRSARAG